MRGDRTIRRLNQRIEELERNLKDAQKSNQTIAAQRETETKRAQHVEAVLSALIGGLDVLVDGAQVKADEAGREYYDAKCAEFKKRADA